MVTESISVALLLYPGLGLALSEERTVAELRGTASVSIIYIYIIYIADVFSLF